MKSIAITLPDTHAFFNIRVPDCVVAYSSTKLEGVDTVSALQKSALWPQGFDGRVLKQAFIVTLRALTPDEASKNIKQVKKSIGASFTWVFQDFGGLLRPEGAMVPTVEFKVYHFTDGSWLIDAPDLAHADVIKCLCTRAGSPHLFRSKEQSAKAALQEAAQKGEPA